jgi:hypothetical protein
MNRPGANHPNAENFPGVNVMIPVFSVFCRFSDLKNLRFFKKQKQF